MVKQKIETDATNGNKNEAKSVAKKTEDHSNAGLLAVIFSVVAIAILVSGGYLFYKVIKKYVVFSTGGKVTQPVPATGSDQTGLPNTQSDLVTGGGTLSDLTGAGTDQETLLDDTAAKEKAKEKAVEDDTLLDESDAVPDDTINDEPDADEEEDQPAEPTEPEREPVDPYNFVSKVSEMDAVFNNVNPNLFDEHVIDDEDVGFTN